VNRAALAAYVGNERLRARGPGWVPDGALAAWDFANGRFWRAAYGVDGAVVTIALRPFDVPQDIVVTDTDDVDTTLTGRVGAVELPVELPSLKLVVARRA